MYMCIDVGNTQIHCGFYKEGVFERSFRLNTKVGWSSDQLGIFIKSFCQEHTIGVSGITNIAISSVVPSLDHHLKNACLKYLNKEPLFVKGDINIGIGIKKFRNYQELGADKISSTVGAAYTYPNKNLFIVDMGTATTITALDTDKEFITGVIMPGVKTQIDSLASAAEKLSTVELVKPDVLVPQSTTEAIQMGIYYSHLGGIKLLLEELADNLFHKKDFIIVGTGGYSRLFKENNFFYATDPNLILKGLVKIIELN